MNEPFGELSAPRRELGAALRQLRSAAGISGQQLAERLAISQSRVSRIELGQQPADPALVARWLQAVAAPPADTARVTQLANVAATHAAAWGKQGLAAIQADTHSLEATAATLRAYHPTLIPGLLQVPGYARLIFEAGNEPGRPDIAAGVAARMQRQTILYEDPPRRIELIITEAALRWPVGPPAVMRAQLDRISQVTSLEGVLIGVIQLNVPAWRENGFDIYDDRGDAGDAAVHVETVTTGLTLTDPADVKIYQDIFGRLRETAATGEQARHLIRGIYDTYAG